jgi:hypothetical protein
MVSLSISPLVSDIVSIGLALADLVTCYIWAFFVFLNLVPLFPM